VVISDSPWRCHFALSERDGRDPYTLGALECRAGTGGVTHSITCPRYIAGPYEHQTLLTLTDPSGHDVDVALSCRRGE
jgi:hypothetical protein